MLTFRALKHRSFTLLWTGQTLSRLGDYVYEIALSWWILQKTGSVEAMGLMWVFVVTPSVLLLLFGGAMVDRLPRIRLMVTSDVGRSVVVLIVTALAYFDQLQVWQVYATSLFFGMVDAFFSSAYAALIPQIIPEEDLSSANALTSISSNLGRVVGPSLGAWIVAWVGNSATFFYQQCFFSRFSRVPDSAVLCQHPAPCAL